MPRKTSLKTLRLKAWRACSLFVRQRDTDPDGFVFCYTCGNQSHWKSVDAGHAIPGRTNAVLFDTDIIRPQCKVCNIWNRGRLHIFSTKLIKEHGLDWWEDKLKNSKQIVKLNRSDYLQLAEDFALKTKQLEVNRRAEKWTRKEDR